MAIEVDIKGIDKAQLLKALWEGSHEQGLSFLGRPSVTPGIENFRSLVEPGNDLYFDYLLGRVIKCDLSGDTMSTALYDRDCGEGACERAVEAARRASNG